LRFDTSTRRKPIGDGDLFSRTALSFLGRCVPSPRIVSGTKLEHSVVWGD
jgi:hypothetical protein